MQEFSESILSTILSYAGLTLSNWTRKWLVYANSTEPGQPEQVIRTVWLGSIMLAGQLQVLNIPKKWQKSMDSSKNGRWTRPFKKFSKLRVKIVMPILDGK